MESSTPEYLLPYLKSTYKTKYIKVMDKLNLDVNEVKHIDDDDIYEADCCICGCSTKYYDRCAYYYLGFGKYLCVKTPYGRNLSCMQILLTYLAKYQRKIPKKM